MKALKLVIIGLFLFSASNMEAQISVSFHIGSPPQWGPVGYDNNVRYYYLPDLEAYYDIKSSMFIYYSSGEWIYRTRLPFRYRNYDLYNGYKVVMSDYRGNTPYIHHQDYKNKYAKGYRGKEQKNFGAKPGNRETRGGTNAKEKSHEKKNSNKKGNSHIRH